MKKLATLILAAGLVIGSVTGASAIDFKAKGQWIMSFDYGSGATGMSSNNAKQTQYGYGSGQDSFNAKQRVRLQLEAVASESLSGTVYFEMGDTTWGADDGEGGALGADGKIVAVKHAYLDWIVPNTELKVRMGIQGIALPSYTTGGSQVFNQDVAGIVLSNKFTDNVAMTLFWARPYNDNYNGTDQNNNANYLDNVDVFGLALPLTFDGFNMVPWVVYTTVGQNAVMNTNTQAIIPVGGRNLAGLAPAVGIGAQGSRNDINAYSSVWHAGLTGEVTMADPFRFAWDFNYGSADFGVADNAVINKRNIGARAAKDMDLKRSGFLLSLLAEYKMDWGTPGLYAWYTSGDDSDPYNGSERMPVLNNGNSDTQFSNFAMNGSPYISREGVISNNLVGTWGIGVRVKDFSFVEDLKHTFRINYLQGTNSTVMAKYIDANPAESRSLTNYTSALDNSIYMTTADSAWEFGLSNDYQIYENLKLFVDVNYLALNMSQESHVWGADFTATDAFNINASFVYSF